MQWAAAIRLSLFEHTSLHEAYTGSLIAAKAKTLSGANFIMERTRFKHEDWARVRFGAGTPWRRCWFVVSPPDEKEVQKARKTLKRQSAYDRSPPLIRGDIKFYESKKTKRSKPMATITNAYAAYAIYPQAVPLIDQSTLVKIEGTITIHSPPFQSSSEGLVFVMPETHAAVTGFETMLRFLVPTFDTFHLYGRPTRLIAATNHIKSIMFAFPKHRRYGYLEVLDIANLMQAPDSRNWNEGQWRQQLKEATMNRMSAGGSTASSISSSKPRYRASMPNRQSNMPVGGPRLFSPMSDVPPSITQSADNVIPERPRNGSPSYHSHGSSDNVGLSAPFQPRKIRSTDSPVSSLYNSADERPGTGSTNDRRNAEEEWRKHGFHQIATVREDLVSHSPPAPVSSPPVFAHGPGETPLVRPRPSRDARNANNRMSNATFMQLAAASNMGGVGAGRSSASPAAKSSTEGMSQQHLAINNSPYSSAAHGLGVSDVNWRASSEVVASSSPVVSTSSPNPSGGTPPINKARLSLDTGKAIKRKPAPPVGVTSPAAEPSLEELRHTLDEDVLNKIAPHQQSATSPSKDSRQDEESVYDDMSAASPDYSSTHGSIHSKESVKSVQRPRMGVMKTVGGGPTPQRGVVIGDSHYPLEQPPQSNPDIPHVDFGPTMTYLPTDGRPSTADTLKQSEHQRNGSDATEKESLHVPTHVLDTGSRDERRRSSPQQTPYGLPGSSGYGAPIPPMHAQRRVVSKTPPPLQRPVSGGWMPYSKSNPHLESARPNPRASMMGPNDVSHLSAREQEHVARKTRSSFFNLTGAASRPQPQMHPRGLVGEIDAREREKRGLREGMSNHMVQHAIAQRQQHMQYQHPRASMPPQYGLPPNGYRPYSPQPIDPANNPYYVDDARRQTWYGPSHTPPAYPRNQFPSQQAGYFGSMH